MSHEQKETADVPAPPEQFNFADFLLARNADHAHRPAFIDDSHTLTHGELATRVRRMATALRSLGIRREERVLLLMQDCNDWPVSFFGALYAGPVQVSVNNLPIPLDYPSMRPHLQVKAVVGSGPLLTHTQ